jgi:hypothetical protein
MSGDSIRVEVVFALPERQVLVEVSLEPTASVADAIEASGIARTFPGEDLEALPVGIWGKPASRAAGLQDGDRVEIYRPLLIDPKEARRRRATLGRTMKDADDH